MADLRRTPRLAAEPTPPAPARPGPSTPPTGPAPHPSPPGAVTAQGSRHGTSTPGGHPSPLLPFSGPPEAAGNLSPVTAPEAAPGASGAGRGQAQPPSPVSPVRASGASAELRDRGRATRAGTVTGGPLVRQAEGAVPAGPKPLRGAEWRQAVKDAQSGRAKAQRRKPGRTARGQQAPAPAPILPAAGPVSALTATASCGSCEWTAGPGDAGEVDKAAEKHVRPGHATATIAEPVGVA